MRSESPGVISPGDTSGSAGAVRSQQQVECIIITPCRPGKIFPAKHSSNRQVISAAVLALASRIEVRRRTARRCLDLPSEGRGREGPSSMPETESHILATQISGVACGRWLISRLGAARLRTSGDRRSIKCPSGRYAEAERAANSDVEVEIVRDTESIASIKSVVMRKPVRSMCSSSHLCNVQVKRSCCW